MSDLAYSIPILAIIILALIYWSIYHKNMRMHKRAEIRRKERMAETLLKNRKLSRQQKQ